jgi:starch synthase
MVAAENDGLQGGKVGGIGDVVRDVPPALARLGWKVSVVTPSYGFLHKTPGSTLVGRVTFPFAGASTDADLYSVPGKKPAPGVVHHVFDHPAFTWIDRGRPQIYRNDPPGRPFASDAHKYALFCAAVAEGARDNLFGKLDCMHLHDWHAAFLLILTRYQPRHERLKRTRTAYTIHNLALQGVRPLQNDPSSLKTWYPDLVIDDLREVADPRWPDCVNPMAVGIRFADAVHTVSPSYAAEILEPSDPPGYYGGEGLEADLLRAKRDGRLHGILNGCEYPEIRDIAKMTLPEMIEKLRLQVLKWAVAQGSVSGANLIAADRLRDLATRCDDIDMVLTSVTRVVDQKMYLLRAPGSDGMSGLHGLLDVIGDRSLYILLGTGDRDYEDFLANVAAEHPNFLFLNGYSDWCAGALYANGDLFVMPSSFEPCGISQMLAMRDGQPCLVHGVGGLKDTIVDGEDGIAFDGKTATEQVDAFKRACARALELRRSRGGAWARLVEAAAARRFAWDDTVRAYATKLYGRVPAKPERMVGHIGG